MNMLIGFRQSQVVSSASRGSSMRDTRGSGGESSTASEGELQPCSSEISHGGSSLIHSDHENESLVEPVRLSEVSTHRGTNARAASSSYPNSQIGLAAAVSGGGGRRSFGRGCGSRAHAATRGSSGEHILFRKCVQLNQERAAMAAAFAAEEYLKQEGSTYCTDGKPNSFIIKSLHDMGVGLSPTTESELEGFDPEDSESESDMAKGDTQVQGIQQLQKSHPVPVSTPPHLRDDSALEPSGSEIPGATTPSPHPADLASSIGFPSQSSGSISLPTTPQVWTPLYQNGSGRSSTGTPGLSGPTTSELVAATSSLRARRAALLALPSLQIPSFLASPGPYETFSGPRGFSGNMLPGSYIPSVQAPLGQLSSFNPRPNQPLPAPSLASVDSDPEFLGTSVTSKTPGWHKLWSGGGSMASNASSSNLATPGDSYPATVATARQEVVPAGGLHEILKVEKWGVLRAVPGPAFSGFMSGPSSPAPPTPSLLARSLSSAAHFDSVPSPSVVSAAAAEAAASTAAFAAASAAGAASPSNPLYKTELCRSWEETGACRYGGKCQFAHGRDELRAVARHPKYKTEVCRTFNLNGTCPYGTRCRFIHYTSASTSAASSPAIGASPIQAHTSSSRIAGSGVGLVPSPFKSQLSLPIARSASSSSGSAFSTPQGSPRRLPVFETICREADAEACTRSRNLDRYYGG